MEVFAALLLFTTLMMPSYGIDPRLSKLAIGTYYGLEGFAEDQGNDLAYSLLSAHNAKRALHSAPPLTLSNKLNRLAKQKADQAAATNSFSQSDDKYGQTEYWEPRAKQPNATAIVDLWYNGIKYYNWQSPRFSMESGAFSQIVWKDTVELGVGTAFIKSNPKSQYASWFVVVLYNPPGNVYGEYNENVQAPQGGFIVAEEPSEYY